MTQYFLDSSALIKHYVVEPGTTWVRSLTNRGSGNPVIIAQIT
jgi:predicted nucleic acid-binding protein